MRWAHSNPARSGRTGLLHKAVPQKQRAIVPSEPTSGQRGNGRRRWARDGSRKDGLEDEAQESGGEQLLEVRGEREGKAWLGPTTTLSAHTSHFTKNSPQQPNALLLPNLGDRAAQELTWGVAIRKGPTVALAGAGSGPPLTSALLSRLASSRSVTVFGPFFFLSLARMEDSRSGNGGISSRTVAWRKRPRVTTAESPAAPGPGARGLPGCRCWPPC